MITFISPLNAFSVFVFIPFHASEILPPTQLSLSVTIFDIVSHAPLMCSVIPSHAHFTPPHIKFHPLAMSSPTQPSLSDAVLAMGSHAHTINPHIPFHAH